MAATNRDVARAGEIQAAGTPHVLIVGAGFAGLEAAKALVPIRPAVHITIIDRQNYHTFTPLLYQVATAALEPEEIAYPIRTVFRGHPNVNLRVAEVVGIDLERRAVMTQHEQTSDELSYDYLIVAPGSRTSFFGIAGAEKRSYGLKDLPEALALRNRLLFLVETAAAERDPVRRREWLRVVVVGGGPTGVELAGAIAELTRAMIGRDFPGLSPFDVDIVLVEAAERLLSTFHPRLSAAALRDLQRRRVQVMLGATVESISETNVCLRGGQIIETPLLVWAAGVHAAPLARDLAAEQASAGRVKVADTLQLTDHPEVYVVGDAAEVRAGFDPLPMLAAVAVQEGRHAGRNVALQIAGSRPLRFHYVNRGTMATIGRSNAVAEIGLVRLTGFPAWFAWLALHLVELIGFRNRVLVLVNWLWEYVFFFRRGARPMIRSLE